MSNKKSLADRILAIQNHCAGQHIDLGFSFDIVEETWQAWDENLADELGGTADSFEGMIEAVEAHFEF